MCSIPSVTSSLSSFSQILPCLWRARSQSWFPHGFAPFLPIFQPSTTTRPCRTWSCPCRWGTLFTSWRCMKVGAAHRGFERKIGTNQDYFSIFRSVFSTSVTPQSTNLVCSGCCSPLLFKIMLKMQKCRGLLLSVLSQAEFIKVRFHQYPKAALKGKQTFNSGCSLLFSPLCFGSSLGQAKHLCWWDELILLENKNNN